LITICYERGKGGEYTNFIISNNPLKLLLKIYMIVSVHVLGLIYWFDG